MRAILTDPEAANAQQQIQALSAYIVELEGARDELARAKRKARDTGGIVPGEPLTYEAWARGFLARVSAPACQENLTIVVTWETAESTEAAFNPLATTHAMDGATDFNSVGVKNYRSLDQGLDAARDTLQGGADSYGYAAILQDLQACASAEMTAMAINASAWCRGCTERRLHHRPPAHREGGLRRPRQPPHLDGLDGGGGGPTLGPSWRRRTLKVGRVALRTSLVTCHNDDSWTR